MITSRERLQAALEHREADRIPLDLGGISGMHIDSVYKLRQALRLDPPGTPVKLLDPFLQLGEIGPDLIDLLGVDVVPLRTLNTRLGFRNAGWKSWTTFSGTPALVPAGFNTEPEPNGSILQFPGGDKTAAPCAVMPYGGFYFDALTRQDPIDEAQLCVEDNLEEFGPISDDDLAYLASESVRLEATGKAVVGVFGGTGFGDSLVTAGLDLKHPKGVRAIDEMYVSLVQRTDYMYDLFDRQCEIALRNLEKIAPVVGDRVAVIYLTGTDFGAQNGPLISPKTYRTLFKPFHIKINEWVHAHTTWKTLMHSCGSIVQILDDILDSGFDCVNPLQTSAAGMDPVALKTRYGSRVTFWGGGIDTQRVLPFGTPGEIREMVRERMRIFGAGGGFVFTSIHHVQAGVPTENLLALYEAVRDYRRY